MPPSGKKSLSNFRIIFRIFRFLKPYRVPFTFASIFLLLGSLCAMSVPWLMGVLIDTGAGKAKPPFTSTNLVGSILVGVLIIQSVLSYFRVSLFATVTEKTMAAVRIFLYEHLLTLSMTFYEVRRVGEIISRSTNDVDQLQDMLSNTLPDFARQLVTIILGIVLLLLTSTKLTLLALAVIPALVIGAVFYGRFIRRLSKERQDALADTSVVIEETLQNIQTVKAFSSEAYEARRYGHSLDKVVSTGIRGAVNRGLFSTFMLSGLLGAFSLVLWYGATLLKSGTLTSGSLTSFMLYVVFIGGAVAQFGDLFARVHKTIGASERLFDILDQSGEFPDSSTAQPSLTQIPGPGERISGELTLEHIGFAYPTRRDVEVLKDISLHIPKGEKIALVGQSGAGKSTIAQLILGFYLPTQGSILLDGRPSTDYNLRVLRSQMAIVPQEVLLFGGSIRENISYGKPGASFEEIRAAAGQANALNFIESFPEGFETIVGERGVKLSGGQRQRIAIARAILKDPALLILDEATSALDAESEHQVQQALEVLMKGRTTLIIAHRLSTIRHVDRIFVLGDGKVLESGSFRELENKQGGAFHHLLQLQFQNSQQKAFV
jgi:ATP-binding cassette subfamily B protein